MIYIVVVIAVLCTMYAIIRYLIIKGIKSPNDSTKYMRRQQLANISPVLMDRWRCVSRKRVVRSRVRSCRTSIRVRTDRG